MIRFVLPELRRIENSFSQMIVMYRFEELTPFRGIASLVDWRLHGHLSRMTIEGFFSGSNTQPLLMPLGRFFPQQFLLLLGLGKRETFNESIVAERLGETFEIARQLKLTDLILSLPGRVENVCSAGDAIDWFIDAYDKQTDMDDMCIIESTKAQKQMSPAVERWRLRGLVPEI